MNFCGVLLYGTIKELDEKKVYLEKPFAPGNSNEMKWFPKCAEVFYTQSRDCECDLINYTHLEVSLFLIFSPKCIIANNKDGKDMSL